MFAFQVRDKPLFIEARKNGYHRARVSRVHGKPVTAPVDGGAQALHLPANRLTIFFLPLPAPLHEPFRTHRQPQPLPLTLPGTLGLRSPFQLRQSLPTQLPFHDHLRSNGGVIGTGQPQHVLAAHAMPAHQDVDFCMLQHVTHVERARDVRRWDTEAKARPRRITARAIQLLLDPKARPARLDGLR